MSPTSCDRCEVVRAPTSSEVSEADRGTSPLPRPGGVLTQTHTVVHVVRVPRRDPYDTGTPYGVVRTDERTGRKSRRVPTKRGVVDDRSPVRSSFTGPERMGGGTRDLDRETRPTTFRSFPPVSPSEDRRYRNESDTGGRPAERRTSGSNFDEEPEVSGLVYDWEDRPKEDRGVRVK